MARHRGVIARRPDESYLGIVTTVPRSKDAERLPRLRPQSIQTRTQYASAGPLMIVLNFTCPGQLEILALLNSRAAQPRVQYLPDRRCEAAFLRRYVVKAFSEGMRAGHEGPWRVSWQRRAWRGENTPEWAPLVVCGRYRLAVQPLSEAMQVRATLNWFSIPQPIAVDRRRDQRGRRPRLDRRGSVLSRGLDTFLAHYAPHDAGADAD